MSVVVKLPTAAKRKVDNARFAAQRRASVAARKTWPAEYRSPRDRAYDAEAALLLAIPDSVATRLLQAIMATLDDKARVSILTTLAPAVVGGSETAKQALALFRSSKLDFGDQYYLQVAMDRLRETRGR